MSPEGVVAVTGASGTLGGAIASALENSGTRIVRLSRTPVSPRDLRFSLGERLSETDFVSRGITAMVHCAYDFQARGWRDVHRVNVAGSLQLLEAAQRAGVRRIVFLSSLAAFDGCASLYGRGKLEVEERVLELGGAVLRPGTVYGPRAGGVMGAILRTVSRGGWTPVLKHPGPLFLAHRDDVASAAVSQLEDTRMHGRPLFAANPRPWTLEEIVRVVAESRGETVRTVPIPWRAAWLAIRAAELVGARPPFRSDSVLSLGVPLPATEISKLSAPPVTFREFNPVEALLP